MSIVFVNADKLNDEQLNNIFYSVFGKQPQDIKQKEEPKTFLEQLKGRIQKWQRNHANII